MVADLIAMWEELGHMLADVQENYADMHPDDVVGVLGNCTLKATVLTQEIAARRQSVMELAPYWKIPQSGADAGMPPGKLRLLLPRPGSVAAELIDPGSAIVSAETGPALIEVDFEGNRHGAANLTRYWARVVQAAGRHVVKYPTIARARVPRHDLIPIGWFDVASQEITLDATATVTKALAAWLGLTNRVKLPGETMRQPLTGEPPGVS